LLVTQAILCYGETMSVSQIKKGISMIKIISIISLYLVALQSHGESLESWLRSLPQVTNVTSSYVSNENCVLIDVRQIHEDPRTYVQDSKYLPILGAVRDDIIAIGTNLQARLNLSSYYLEGYTTNSQDAILSSLKYGQGLYADTKEREKERREAKTKLDQLEANPTTATNQDTAQEIRFLRKMAGNGMPGDDHSAFDRYGTGTWSIHPQSLFLAIESGMEPRLTEDAATLARGLAEINKVEVGGVIKINVMSPESRQLVMTDREREVLKIIARDHLSGAVTNHCSLIIFGGAHDFTESIKAWNAANSFKFSLITVTPKSY